MDHYGGVSKRPWITCVGSRPMSKQNIQDLIINTNGFITTVDGVPVRKIFVGNIRPFTTENDLSNFFKRYGTVVEASVVKPQNKPHFGFVMFRTPAEATSAILNRHQIYLANRKLYISPADSWHQPLELPNGEVVWNRRAYEEEQRKAECENQTDDDTLDYDEEDAEVSGCVQQEPESISDHCPISKLNDDCLMLIFNLIPLHDRLALHKVCQRWKAVSYSMWRSLRKLDFTAEPLVNAVLNDHILRQYLHLCPNVTRLNVGTDNHKLSAGAVVMIAKSCKNLEGLALKDLNLNKRSLAFLARSCPKLKQFSMEACVLRHDNEMIALVKTCKNLEEIAMKECDSHSGLWLRFLQGPLKSLSLDVYEFQPQYLLEGIQNVKSTLKDLKFVGCDSIKSQEVDLIIQQVPELESLTYISGFNDYQQHTFTFITRLNKLKYLDFDNNAYVNDAFLSALADNCPLLEGLSISGIDDCNLSNKGFNAIARMKNLSMLSLGFNKKLSDANLTTFSTKLKDLKHLDVKACSNITDVGCMSVVCNCKQLEIFDVTGCDKVTNMTPIAAGDALKGTARKLRIFGGDTEIDFDLCWPENLIMDAIATTSMASGPRTMFILHPDFEIENDVFFNHLLDPGYEYDLSDDFDDDDDDDDTVCSDDLFNNCLYRYGQSDDSDSDDYEDFQVYFH